LSRVTAFGSYCIPQTGEVNEGGLSQNIVADNPGGVPRKIKIALAFDKLPQSGVKDFWVCPSDKVFSKYLAGIWQGLVRPRRQFFNRGLGTEIT
jgi:hypothetical protein